MANDLISRSALIAEYDRVHIGEPGGARKLMVDAPAVDKWIQVTERLPEEDGRYLCNTRSFAFPGSFYQTIMKYEKGGFIEGYIYTDDVTHWMPLPEPPKED